MKRRSIAIFVLLSLVLAAFCACGTKKEKFSTYSFDYFDTVTTIVGYADTQEEFDAISAEILAELGEYHKLFNIYNRYEGLENLCTVNELEGGAHRVVKVDERIIQMLKYAKEMYEKTGGIVNVAMGSVLSIWHNYREAGRDEPWAAELPPMDALLAAAEHTDINHLVIDEEAETVFLADPKMRLDVGAIAKGYAVEMAARSLEEKGVTGYVINVGGNVRTVGTKGDGAAWTAGIDDPNGDEANPYYALVSLVGESLVTSGSYQRYYVVDGKPYHHIIHPETLMPSEGFVSVSVLTKSSADGDALSTALFCMSVEEGLALVESLEGTEALWVLSDGTRVESSGFAAHLYQK